MREFQPNLNFGGVKIRCPRCKSKLEVEAVGDFVSCPFCHLEFTSEAPKPRRTLKSILSKINWFRYAVLGLATLLGIIPVIGIVVALWIKFKKPELLPALDGFVGGVGFTLGALMFLAFLVLLVVNIILWIFLPLMVYSIKQSLEDAVIQLKKLTNT